MGQLSNNICCGGDNTGTCTSWLVILVLLPCKYKSSIWIWRVLFDRYICVYDDTVLFHAPRLYFKKIDIFFWILLKKKIQNVSYFLWLDSLHTNVKTSSLQEDLSNHI